MSGGIKETVWDRPFKILLLVIFVLILLTATAVITVPQAAAVIVGIFDVVWEFLKALGAVFKEVVAQWKLKN